jgi:alanine racemase
MPRPIAAVVSCPALRHNLQVARSLAAGSRLWAVVKARAYGHGLAHAVQAFDDADGLALLEFDGAQRLRDLGWRKPLLMLEGAFEPQDLETAGRLGLTLAVHHPDQLVWFGAYRGPRLHTYLKINTGMNRLGIARADVADVFRTLARSAGVASVTLMTHFANSDVPGGADAQIDAFESATAGLPGERSLSNSAALLGAPGGDAGARVRGDWVRPGIMLYGATPYGDRDAATLGLRPAMTLRSRLISIQRLAAGDAVGYGSTFVATGPTTIGIVACGYADGYPRHAPTGTPVAVDGVRTRTVGRVSMDMMAVDLGPVPSAGIGSVVELWGSTVAVDDVARSAGTIGYELLCAIAPRVPVLTDPV